jgi:hypothetical protein
LIRNATAPGHSGNFWLRVVVTGDVLAERLATKEILS